MLIRSRPIDDVCMHSALDRPCTRTAFTASRSHATRIIQTRNPSSSSSRESICHLWTRGVAMSTRSSSLFSATGTGARASRRYLSRFGSQSSNLLIENTHSKYIHFDTGRWPVTTTGSCPSRRKAHSSKDRTCAKHGLAYRLRILSCIFCVFKEHPHRWFFSPFNDIPATEQRAVLLVSYHSSSMMLNASFRGHQLTLAARQQQVYSAKKK